MKKIIISALCVFSLNTIIAQTTQYNGSWALCKIVTPQGDTQNVSANDARYMMYSFTYNNTFTALQKGENISGVWSFDFKTKTIRIRNSIYTKTRTKLENYDIMLNQTTPNYFVEIKPESKKTFTYYIYCRIK